MSAPSLKAREAYVLSREVTWNGKIVDCSLRGDALVGAIDETNAQIAKLAGK